MYLPARFENKNSAETFDLISKNPFATVITTNEQGPFVSHLPLVFEKEGDDIFLYGHLARANPHSKILALHKTYVIFHGSHAYISPVWYAENDVPTWNYAVVHMTGQTEMIMGTDGILNCIRKLSAHVEKNRDRKWEFWVPEDLAAPGVLERAISGFKIKVETVHSKFKLGQNRSVADREGVVKGLREFENGSNHEMAELIQNTIK